MKHMIATLLLCLSCFGSASTVCRPKQETHMLGFTTLARDDQFVLVMSGPTLFHFHARMFTNKPDYGVVKCYYMFQFDDKNVEENTLWMGQQISDICKKVSAEQCVMLKDLAEYGMCTSD